MDYRQLKHEVSTRNKLYKFEKFLYATGVSSVGKIILVIMPMLTRNIPCDPQEMP